MSDHTTPEDITRALGNPPNVRGALVGITAATVTVGCSAATAQRLPAIALAIDTTGGLVTVSCVIPPEAGEQLAAAAHAAQAVAEAENIL